NAELIRGPLLHLEGRGGVTDHRLCGGDVDKLFTVEIYSCTLAGRDDIYLEVVIASALRGQFHTEMVVAERHNRSSTRHGGDAELVRVVDRHVGGGIADEGYLRSSAARTVAVDDAAAARKCAAD